MAKLGDKKSDPRIAISREHTAAIFFTYCSALAGVVVILVLEMNRDFFKKVKSVAGLILDGSV